MRKHISRFVVIMLLLLLLACGNTDPKVGQVIQSQMQETDNNKSEDTNASQVEMSPEGTEELQVEAATEENKSKSTSDAVVDVDLTKLSSTMVYSEVYNMMYTPENYIGKTVKMSGTFVTYTNQDESQCYTAVIIADATACCSQGLEFVLEGNPAYPEGYPEMETKITVVGTFETYEEEGNTYCRLQNAKLE